MRLPVEDIKGGILHPEEEVRLTAVEYFAESFSLDGTVMPLVIQAVNKYGRAPSFRLLRKAEQLQQSASTLDWLINQLRENYDLHNISDDNVRFAVALVVLASPTDLLKCRKHEIDDLASFPDVLRGPLDQRLRMMTWGAEQGWEALEELGHTTMSRGEWTLSEHRFASRIIESLAQYSEELEDMVLEVLRKDAPGKDRQLMNWLEADIIELAGRMRLSAAVPILSANLDSDNPVLVDAAGTALVRIGNDAVAEALISDWWGGSDEFRVTAADVLGKMHTDVSAKRCLEFLIQEETWDAAIALGHALLSNFEFEGIDPVRELVLDGGDELGPDHSDLRNHLLAASTIMRVQFPEYKMWYEEAIETNWGWDDFEPPRLADAFRPDPLGQQEPGNGHT